MAEKRLRFLAFYLPQFHVIPENDQWWGEGFTEWTNVRKAVPLFSGHHQPHIPGELGYYNLLDPNVQEKQALLARSYGIDGFCYWHYWFGRGKRLLERPAQQVLQSGQPDFPFCFAWANQSWTGIWHGLDKKVLMNQEYIDREDDERHFHEVLPYLTDARYIKFGGKPVFILYRPYDHPYLDSFIEHWQNLAIRAGLRGIHFLGISYTGSNPYQNLDGIIKHDAYFRSNQLSFTDKAFRKLLGKYPEEWLSEFLYGCHRVSYADMVERTHNQTVSENWHPTIHVGWDNTPRSGRRGKVFYDFSLALLAQHIDKAVLTIQQDYQSLVFVKSWNEWAEGNYLEPDTKFGLGKLETFRSVLNGRGYL